MPSPAFPRLSFSNQQKVRWHPRKESTQSTLWMLSPRIVAYTHEVQEHPTSCILLDILIQLWMWLIHPFPPASLHKTQIVITVWTKRLLTNSFKTSHKIHQFATWKDRSSQCANDCYLKRWCFHKWGQWAYWRMVCGVNCLEAAEGWADDVSHYATASSIGLEFFIHSLWPAAEVLL